ncbi:tetratricopeptide repeat protein [Prevotella sp. 10(H)]|uniref:tetratricopeptide repeat protein n=1 Tax=Prevotella sp. 10(H) TaxID=1158294 RepID=UPI000ADF166E|nr:tetratricopeptide repeat protein [Prevotella sp. 10(H)]
MKTFAFLLLASLFICPAFMDSTTLQSKNFQVVKPRAAISIKQMFENGQYSEIIEKYGKTPRTSTADQLAYVAESYLRLDDLTNASRYADLAIQKSAKNSQALFIKGSVNSANGKYTEAIADLQKAISLSPKQSGYYAGLGDIYFAQEDYTKAMDNYRKAINLPNPSEKAYYMIGAVHANQNNLKQALDTFYVAKSKVQKDKELYVTILYNIGKTEFDAKNYSQALTAYTELTDHFPDDYYSLEKLIECNNALGYYDQADAAKKKLFTAYQNGELWSTSISDMCCVDHFTVGDKEVSAYERYEDAPCSTIDKYIFYVADKDGQIGSTITLELTPAEEGKSARLDPVMVKGDNKYGFSIVYDANLAYTTIRTLVQDIIQGKVESIPYVK